VKNKAKFSKRVSYAKYGYIFSLPFVLAFVIFQLYPLLFTTLMGFTDMSGVAAQGAGLGDLTFNWNIMGPDGYYLSPFHTFIEIFNSPLFRLALRNTVVIWLMNFIPQIILSLALAAWFTNKMLKLKWVGGFKVLFYMPNIITAASIALLFSAMFGHPIGPVNDFLIRIGMRDGPTNILATPLNAQIIVAFIQFWMWYGVTMIILIAGIMGISPSLFEAAAIDGASHIKAFIYITLPSLRTIVLFVLVTSFVGGMQMFDIPNLFNDGGPQNATLTSSLFIFNQAFGASRMFSRAAAASMLMFIIICAFSGLIFYLMRDKDVGRERRERRAAEKARRASV